MTGAQEFPEEYLGLPGDNLNLYAVMKLFQESETLESFERSLNDESSRINNLDLNGDNLVDYLMVVDYVDGNTHTIVLRAALTRNEMQDVAVFTVQRFADESVQIQLVGDEALYGKNYIIEPIYAEDGETPNPGYIGTTDRGRNVTVVRTTSYEVATWPLISFIFRPTYVVWRSAWHWDYYPTYWNPWRPFYWHAYYGYHYNWHNHYYAYYRPWHHHRHHHYTNFYYSRVRTYSPTVVVNINNGNYRNTYSRPDTREVGEKLYARSNNGRSSLNSDAARVRTSGSTSVNRAAVKSGSDSGRRSSAAVNGRSNTSAGSELRSNNNRRTSEGVSSRNSSGTTINRNAGVERKSGTINTDRSGRRSDSGSSTSVSRKAEPSSSARTATPPSVGRSTEVTRSKSATTSPRRASPSPEVRQSSSQKPSAAVSGRSSGPSVRQSAPRQEAPKVSSGNAQRSQPAVKSAPSRSSSRSSGASVGSSRSGNRGSASAPARSSSRSSSSENSGRR
jgi:hypothetical protein